MNLTETGPFFAGAATPPLECPSPVNWQDEAQLFGFHPVAIGVGPPAWTRDPLSEPNLRDPSPNMLLQWWEIEDFSHGDIKRIWEFSRFDWVLAFAQRGRLGDKEAIERLNLWIADWVRANPPYQGPNWKCAQEASIRLLHLSVAGLILGIESRPTAHLNEMLDMHLKRIVPTLSYAQAQDNNHATSEAAALFVAGAWFQIAGIAGADSLLRRGRELLERTVARLFMPDGSFSQYSLNYHRVALDTLSLVEIWRRRARLEPFSATWNQRASAASHWLRAMIDPISGDAPNLGANDGANLLPLTNSDYRDYRPAVQLSYALFRQTQAYPTGPWNDALVWLGVKVPTSTEGHSSRAIFDDGGYAVLRSGRAMAMLRYPRFRFRPSQADALHLDFWLDGRNLLRDGGTYSYNADAEWIEYFGGAASHNSMSFDDQPQMPRLSRFLLGDWLKTETSGATDEGFVASYRHRLGWWHNREVCLGAHLTVIDTVGGFSDRAHIQWRLAPGNWIIDGAVVTNGRDSLSLTATVPITSFKIKTGWESRYYLDKTIIPVLEATITQPGQLITEYHWAL